MAGCKKSSNTPAAPDTPASSTQWTFGNTSFKGEPAQWFYDSAGMLGILATQDSTGVNQLGVEFLVSDPSARPAP
ncbi:MAG TPA: hypothetical protein VHW43_06205, partial [Puia sp.]|nr:hypothetical protein [Puia sp.]